MHYSDEELMLKYRNGDESAFDIIYYRYERQIFSFIYRNIMNIADTEDLCQETFFRVAQEKEKYKKSGKFKTWLFQIALNLCRDKGRRRKFRSHLSIDAPILSRDSENTSLKNSLSNPNSNPQKDVETNEIKSVIEKAFTTLSEEQRTVVILKEYHTLKFSEIAEILNCPIGTVKSLNHRGYQKLKNVLSKYLDE